VQLRCKACIEITVGTAITGCRPRESARRLLKKFMDFPTDAAHKGAYLTRWIRAEFCTAWPVLAGTFKGGSMHVQIATRNWVLPETDRDVLERRIERVRRKLPTVNSELLHMVVRLDKHAKREEFICTARVAIMNRVIAARGRYQTAVRSSIGQTFDDLEREVDKFIDALKARV
jgi:ribosome-associated translation inhibitor RaiA